MDAQVTINFAGGVASTNLVQVILGQAVLALESVRGALADVMGFTNMTVHPAQVTFATPSGGAFVGTLALTLSWNGEDPTVTLDNLVPSAHGGPATITWPTANGPETQILTTGNALTLSGIVAD
ncbi:hypothetical protein JMG10_29855 [Nostoc ellipsosporum NOK]|uniref:hypothetical protein n=1 Tax=Sphingomonas sp. IBVSS2 TaxID=1985172 RepID=UPI000A2E55D6|nr:hypothetical protein [Sphingomonas sp. IBVSS2]MDF2385708.1 hypothetical protein [Nostoc ellipsosporum NOK]OSZ65050.1 hypothetical protein CAP40_14630 [Sphingomonas sp. IBVSS2]